MVRLNAFALVGCLGVSVLVAGCGRTAVKPETSTADGSAPAGSRSAALADFEIAEGIAQGRLTVFPVLSKTPRTDDRFITLDEGLLAGTVEVFEVGANPARSAIQTGFDVNNDDAPRQTAGRPASVAAPQSDAAD